MEATVENALDITKKAAHRLFYKKYRGWLRDWDEFYSDAQLLVFQKFANFDPKIGTFEGYINMYVEFAAKRLLSAGKKMAERGVVTHLGTIDDVSLVEKDVPEELDFLLRRAIAIFEESKIKRSDSIRKRLKTELFELGWTKKRIAEAFSEIDSALSSDKLRCYVKKEPE